MGTFLAKANMSTCQPKSKNEGQQVQGSAYASLHAVMTANVNVQGLNGVRQAEHVANWQA